MKNERTSARVAKIAGKVLAMEKGPWMNSFVQVVYARNREWKIVDSGVSWRDIRMLAASALTQAPDKGVTHTTRTKVGLEKALGIRLKSKRLKRARKKLQGRPADKARAAFRQYIEATATSPDDDRPKRKAKR